MSNHQPLVSVYIPTRNRAGLLKRAIDSALQQTWENIEIIVVDDASDDETPKLLSGVEKENPVTMIRNKNPKGAAASRNIAIEHANGEFVAGLDDDDFWRPNRIESLMKAFERGYSAVCSDDLMAYGNKERIWKKKPVITLYDLLYYNRVGNQVLTKKEYILKAGGYDENLQSAQDYDLWIRLAEQFGPVKSVKKPLQVISVNSGRESITSSSRKMEGYLACFEKHKPKMNDSQIKYQNYRLKLAAGEKISWAELFQCTPLHLLKKEIARKLFL